MKSIIVALLPLVACFAKESSQGSVNNAGSATPLNARLAGPSAQSSASNSLGSLPQAEHKSGETTGAALVVHPGISIGTFRIGEVQSVSTRSGLTPHPRWSAMTIPFQLSLDKSDMLRGVSVSLKHVKADLVVDATRIPRSATYRDVQRLLGDCVEAPPMEGGTVSKCRAGKLTVSIGSGDPSEVWIGVP